MKLSSFANDGNGDFHDDVGMQCEGNWLLSGGSQRARRQANLYFFHCQTVLEQGFGDVEVTDRTEQNTVDMTKYRTNISL